MTGDFRKASWKGLNRRQQKRWNYLMDTDSMYWEMRRVWKPYHLGTIPCQTKWLYALLICIAFNWITDMNVRGRRADKAEYSPEKSYHLLCWHHMLLPDNTINTLKYDAIGLVCTKYKPKLMTFWKGGNSYEPKIWMFHWLKPMRPKTLMALINTSEEHDHDKAKEATTHYS